MASLQPFYSDLVNHWNLDQSITFLNHGSFGAAPIEVLEQQHQFRMQLENQPLRFFMRELPELHVNTLQQLGIFLSCNPEDLVFVKNATEGVNTVLSSIPWKKNDRVLITNHGYQACKNALLINAQRYGFEVDEVQVPYPYESEDEIVNAVLDGVSKHTRLVMIDHISSPTALYFPIEKIAAALKGTQTELLVDGAHAPGMIPIHPSETGAQYYTGNCHKWLCAPKGAAFLWVDPRCQEYMYPLNISMINVRTQGFQDRFYWGGTQDVSPYLSIPKAIETLPKITQISWSEIMEKNRALSRKVTLLFSKTLEQPIPSPLDRITNMCAIPIPKLTSPLLPGTFDPLQEKLYHEFKIEIPVINFGVHNQRFIRFSCFVYNHISQYEYLAEVLKNELKNR
ncbi:MAG TPA: aminotransferase class V-fold PLP-dependent enzyme [Bacteroidales bacterium]|nr:aminotransferase class V-fold PLP-dependent enzyme [Bacteroidales bacterium]